MTITITINSDSIHRLDLSPVQEALKSFYSNDKFQLPEEPINFSVDYPREPTDPRELSEIPEIRLWFIRLDSKYPWLPLFLDWQGGELARYIAMLVPHQFSRAEGIQFNPEALEIWVMKTIFSLTDWLKSQGINRQGRLKAMAQTLGYELEDSLFELL